MLKGVVQGHLGVRVRGHYAAIIVSDTTRLYSSPPSAFSATKETSASLRLARTTLIRFAQSLIRSFIHLPTSVDCMINIHATTAAEKQMTISSCTYHFPSRNRARSLFSQWALAETPTAARSHAGRFQAEVG